MRSDWTALPDAVTGRIADLVGEELSVTPAAEGDHADIAATVSGPGGPRVFVKAASDEFGVRSLRYELAATTAVGRYAPAVRWHFETDGWLVVATEHLDGPHPDLSPGSPDLALLAAALRDLQETAAPAGNWFTAEGRCGFRHPAAEGTTLVHSDLNPANLIVTPAGLRIVDWAWMTRAAAWVEPALLAPWLIGSGHTAEQAEEWLARFPAWHVPGRAVLDAFASHTASRWAARARPDGARWVRDLAAWSGAWAAYRGGGGQTRASRTAGR